MHRFFVPAAGAAILTASASAAGADIGGACPSPTDGGQTMRVEAEGLKDRTGRLIAEIYPANERDFLRDGEALRREGKLFRRIVVPVPPRGPATLCVVPPRAGDYALVLIHDRDGRDRFSIWKDGVGLPIGTPLGTARPRVSQARLSTEPRPLVRIRLQYLRAGAFAPAAAR